MSYNDLQLPNARPWLKQSPKSAVSTDLTADQTVSAFFSNFIMFPCSHSSNPGFLEHLPSMFQEANVTTRSALRFAVRATAYADATAQEGNDGAREMALVWYGRALESLGEALKTGTQVDDHVLMTIVVLDLFEVSFAYERNAG
jgi:hypothetical protein